MRIATESQHARRLTVGGLLGVAAVLGVCVPAWANSVTAMMGASIVHLIFGNFFIAVAEWIVLQWMCPEARRRGALFWLIVANYASAWAGAWLLPLINDGVLSSGGAAEFAQVRWNIVVLLAVMVWVTLVIEAPFYWLAARRPSAAWRFVKPLLAAHVLSYGLLAAWYGLAFESRLIWGTEVVPISAVGPRSHGGWVYYVDSGNHWRRVRLDGSRDEAVDAPETSSSALDEYRLEQVLIIDKTSDGSYRLLHRPDAEDGLPFGERAKPPGREDRILVDRLPGVPAQFAADNSSGYPDAVWDSRFTVAWPAIATHLPEWRAGAGQPHLRTFFTQLTYVHPARGRLVYAMDLPWQHARIRFCTLVDTHCVVVEIMSFGIFVLDLDHDRIAKLADGQVPIVVMDP